MTTTPGELAGSVEGPDNGHLFESIARDLLTRGYSINHRALHPALGDGLLLEFQKIPPQQLLPAGVGRERGQNLNTLVRRDRIRWITGESHGCCQWLAWCSELQTFLNRRLLLGLFSFESHFAYYPQGAFYRRHLDAFKGKSNRILSVVAYLNREWSDRDGGELVLYPQGNAGDGTRVSPTLGTLVLFLSEDIEHEVLPAGRDRISIAGWFRTNSSINRRADPPP